MGLRSVYHNGHDHQLDDMGVDELEDIKVLVTDALNNIKMQIDEAEAANTKGVPVDLGWYARVKQARRIKGQDIQKINRALRNKNRAATQAARPVAEVFMDVAREILRPAEFELILNYSKERLA